MTMTFEGAKQGVDSVQEAVSRESKEYVLAYHEAECERLKAQHKLITKHMQSNFSAPILADLQKGIKVLDAGCGPGAWTCEMAEMYPASTFHGIDLNPVFPRNGQPKNVRFDVAKIGEPLAFPDNTFQLVHQRLVAIGLSAADWDVALKEHTRVLQPGGWLELNEGDLEAQNMGPKTHMLIRAYLEMTRSRNLIPLIARELKGRLEKLQMRNVTEICVTMLMNDENDGQLTLWDCLAPAFQNMQPYLSKMNTAFEDNDYFAKYLKEVGDECREYKTTIRMHRVFGQKP